jgi:hypothetical protein
MVEGLEGVAAFLGALLFIGGFYVLIYVLCDLLFDDK